MTDAVVSSPTNKQPTTDNQEVPKPVETKESLHADDEVKNGSEPAKVEENDQVTKDSTDQSKNIVTVEKGPKKRGRKPKTAVENETATAQDEETESETEKPAVKKPRGRPVGSTNKQKKQLGRPKKTKATVDDSETEDEGESLETQVSALPAEITAKFGSIVWVKMAGYPYWPALITDPRRLPSYHQQAALKDLTTKYYVRFYKTSDFSATLFKNVEAWDDTKVNYRDGFPVKDAKAPKRRGQLMEAIKLADDDLPRPIEERMDGLLKVVENNVEGEVQSKKTSAGKQTNASGKRGRPFGSKNKPKDKVSEDKSPKTGAGRGRKKAESGADDEELSEPASEPAPVEEEETATTPALSKDEIKAKVASRKAPSKKKAATEANGAVSKAKAVTKVESIPRSEMDSKRKKEIELVVPRKSVKSSDIRRATDEAVQKNLGKSKEKVKERFEYTVGSLMEFAIKLTRLHANESSKNNNELIQMMTQLFQETQVHRVDVESSGIAAIVSVLRKSSNPTVSKTASAVRKHLMKVLIEDTKEPAQTTSESDTSMKKHKLNEVDGSDVPAKKQKKEIASPQLAATSPSKTSDSKNASAKEEKAATVHTDKTEEVPVPEKKESTKDEKPVTVHTDKTKDIPAPEKKESDTLTTAKKSDTVKSPVSSPTKKANVVKSPPVAVAAVESEKADPMADKTRKGCIEMLSNALKSNGDAHTRIAKEIEEQVFDRFKETNDEYRASARTITFGLRKSATLRERLFNGDLHALELAYANDEFFEA